jgi:hypothetical protein
MATKLEKVLELLINENEKEASALLHEWFVEKAREIHNQLIEEEDSVLEDEAGDEMAAETFYEEGEDEEGEDMDMDDAEMEVDADLGDEEGPEDMEGEEPVELDDRMDDLEAELAELKAEFEKLMGDEEGDDMGGDMDADMGDDMDADMGDDMGDDMDADMPEEEPKESMGFGEGVYESEDEDEDLEEAKDEDEDLDESFDLDEDEFADLEESAMSMLQSVKNQNSEAEVAAGKKVTVQKTSPLPSHPTDKRVEGGKPVQRKSTEYSGYNMETPPAVKQGTGAKSPSNVMKKSKDALHSAPKAGAGSALLNKVEGGEGNKVSPVATKRK